MMQPDLDSLRAGRRPDELAARISRSIGTPPRRLPSRTILALEAVAPRLTVATLLLFVTATLVSLASRGRGAVAQTSVMAAALDGRMLRAQDVYAAMTGISGEREAGQ